MLTGFFTELLYVKRLTRIFEVDYINFVAHIPHSYGASCSQLYEFHHLLKV